MTQQPNILEAAKQGNPQAIAALLSRNLQPKGITVKVASKPDGVLQILLEAAQAPDPQESVTFIQQGMVKLQPAGVRSLRIFGKAIGEEIPHWSREIELGAIAAPSPTPASEPQETKPGTVEGFKALIQSQGHLPTGMYGTNLGIDDIAQYLASEAATEQLIDLTGVRYLGQTSFLVLTDQRLFCVTMATGSFSLVNKPKPQFSQALQAVEKVAIGFNGLMVDGKNLYFVQPKLGTQFAQTLSSHVATESVSAIASDKHEKKQLALGCGIMVLGLGILWVLFAAMGNNSGSSGGGGRESSASAIVACQNAVKAQLKSPSTAKFPGMFERPEAVKVRSKWQWAAWVDSQNSFGATIRTQFICESDGDSASVQFLN